MATAYSNGDSTVLCSDGCPVVIYEEDWAYHLSWHESNDRPYSARDVFWMTAEERNDYNVAPTVTGA
jgi:hypothetical protein